MPQDTLPSSCATTATPARALTADERACAMREMTELASNLALLAQQLEQTGTLPPSLAEPVLKLSEARLARLASLAGVDIDSAREREERYALLRAANLRVRALEAQLGERAGEVETALGLRRLGQKLRHWWRTQGLGHMTELSFTEHGQARLVLGCHLFGNFRLIDSPTPASDPERRERWLQALRERGLELVQEGYGANDWRVRDTESSRAALLGMVSQALAGARLMEVLTSTLPSGDVVLEDLVVQLTDLSAVHALPAPDTATLKATR